jgi:hypothetical protein
MRRKHLAGLCAAMMVAACATGAMAADENVTAKKILIKDNEDITKRQIFAQSADEQITYADAVDPASTGASIHVWSDTDDFCYVLTASNELWTDTGKAWKYKNPDTKNQATIQAKKVSFKLKSDVGFSLADDGTQGTVNASVQFGPAGTRFCMTCTTPKKNVEFQYQAKDCTAGSCASEPAGCDPVATTTTTAPTTTTTLPGTVVGAIAANGRFNLNMQVGVPAAEAACDSNFPGSHLCKYNELVASQGALMTGLQDTTAQTVTSFWAYDPEQTGERQCIANISNPDSPRWTYATGHQGVGGDQVPLTNATGTLGAIVVGGGANRNCFDSSWIGCCDAP